MLKIQGSVLSEADNDPFTLITGSETEDVNDPCQIVDSDDDVEDDIDIELLF